MKISIALATALVLGLTPLLMNADEPDVEIEVNKDRTAVQERNQQERELRDRDDVRSPDLEEDEGTVPDGLVRASQMIDTAVYNNAEEQVGTIHDVVIDINNGKIKYVAFSTGGFLGLGDKMFAIPYEAFVTKVQDDERVCVLNVAQETLENAKGFDQENWPNAADKTWVNSNNTRTAPRTTSLDQ
jgi:sporulation protein YlmC with PRC-barrel domain